jgi:hypothetical protein
LLVTPPQVEASQVLGVALYTAKAVLAARGAKVAELVETNFLQ